MTDHSDPRQHDEPPARPEVPGPADRGEASAEEGVGGPWADLRTKPILEWTREDWRRWVEGPAEPISASNGGTPAEAAPVPAGPSAGAAAPDTEVTEVDELADAAAAPDASFRTPEHEAEA